jgi:hypothetical protein
MKAYEFPSLLPVLPRLPTSAQWNVTVLRLDDPRREVLATLQTLLTQYESCRREYSASSRAYLQRRALMQPYQSRVAQPDAERPRNSGPSAGAISPGEEVGPALELAPLLAVVEACHRKARELFENVSAAYHALELMDPNGGGGGLRAMTELRACFATELPTRRAHASLDGLPKRPGSGAAAEPQRRDDSPGQPRVASEAASLIGINLDDPGRSGPQR